MTMSRAACWPWRLALLAIFTAPLCHAEVQIETLPGVTLNAGLRAGFAAVTMFNANLGRGQVDFLTGKPDGDPSWAELQLTPWLEFTTTSKVYGNLSVVGATTFFDGDPAAFARGGDGGVDFETAQLGWRSGVATDDTERPVIDFSFGRQTLDIGDGFLIDDGNFDLRQDGATWLVPRQAFEGTVIARIDYRALHADLFYLESDPDNDHATLAGGNLEYQFTRGGHVGLLYANIFDTATPRYFGVREGMDVLSVRVNDLRFDVLPQLAWWGEATRESGDGRFGRIDASAWYGEAIYHFVHLPWQPRLSYRYAWFSGDANPGDTVRRDFDPLFYGFDKRGWGTWFQGEAAGGWLLFNNNQRNHLVHLAANPLPQVTVGVIGGSFFLVERNFRGTPVSGDHFGDEFNLYTDWVINNTVSLSLGYAVLFPGEAAIQGIGDDEVFHLLEMALAFSF